MIKVKNRSQKEIAEIGRKIGEAFAAEKGRIASTVAKEQIIKSFEIMTESFYRAGVLYTTSEKGEGLAEENANRLMLKYYEYLLRIKNYFRENYSMDVLHNLEKFPIEIDNSYKEYYEKIADKIDLYHTPIREGFRFDRFYIQSIKPFFVRNKVYYEESRLLTTVRISHY